MRLFKLNIENINIASQSKRLCSHGYLAFTLNEKRLKTGKNTFRFWVKNRKTPVEKGLHFKV